SLVSATLSGNTLTLDYQENQNGTASVTVRGTSNGKTADSTFTVTVNAVDDPPTVASPLPDVTVDEDSADTVISLENVFTDVDNDDTAIVISVQSNTGEQLLSASLTGTVLTLDYQVNQSGTAVITILGTSGEQTVTDGFTVTVNDVNSYISGKITYYSNGSPVIGTLLTLEGADASYSATVSKQGTYMISSIPSGYDYALTPSRDDDPGTESLSAADASKIARYVVGLAEMTELEKLAADVSGNGIVSIIDASRLARCKAGLITQMNDHGKHWTFSPVSKEYYPLDSDISGQNFAAVRIGDVSGTWQAEPPKRSGQKIQTSEVSETSEVSLAVKTGAQVSVPIVIGTDTPVEGIDITVSFDGKVLDASEVTLAGGILENEDYELVANTGTPGRVTAVIFAKSHLFTGRGTVATLNFRVAGEADDSAVLTFREFECNRIPVSSPVSGFYTDRTVSPRLKIIVEENGIMIYDLNRDGRIGLQDAVRALREENPEAAIKVLQCITGKQ
ncbi:MAG: hypothetical protein GY800_12985, partial [Planctomycetes bacterium]|nr:hypothetical protein [Planctomycetota bacterium]